MPIGESGDLLIKGDSICGCYWNKHEETKDTIQGQWIRTGDKYTRDEDGYFWYQGRSDDMLKVGGAWVSPVEVESALIQHPAVLEHPAAGCELPKDVRVPYAGEGDCKRRQGEHYDSGQRPDPGRTAALLARGLRRRLARTVWGSCGHGKNLCQTPTGGKAGSSQAAIALAGRLRCG